MELATLPAWTTIFLREYEAHGLLATAARAAGTTIKAIDKLKLECIEFETAVEEAEEIAADRIEKEAHRRAVDGVVKGVYYKGDRVDEETVYSDTLMVKMLEAKRRRQFGNKAEISGPNGGPLVISWRTFDLPDASLNTPINVESTDVTQANAPSPAGADVPTVSYRSFPQAAAAAQPIADDVLALV